MGYNRNDSNKGYQNKNRRHMKQMNKYENNSEYFDKVAYKDKYANNNYETKRRKEHAISEGKGVHKSGSVYNKSNSNVQFHIKQTGSIKTEIEGGSTWASTRLPLTGELSEVVKPSAEKLFDYGGAERVPLLSPQFMEAASRTDIPQHNIVDVAGLTFFINYKDIPRFGEYDASGDQKVQFRVAAQYEGIVNERYNLIKASQMTNLAIFNYIVSNIVPGTSSSNNYLPDTAFTAMTFEIQEILAGLIYLAGRYDLIRAMSKLIMRNEYGLSPENINTYLSEISRSSNANNIRTIKSFVKDSYVDKEWIETRIKPIIPPSKETDGMDSVLLDLFMELQNTNYTYTNNNTTPAAVFNFQSIIDSINLVLTYFNIRSIVDAARNNNMSSFLSNLTTNLNDLVTNKIPLFAAQILDYKAAMAVAEGNGLTNFKRGLEMNEFDDIDKFTFWEPAKILLDGFYQGLSKIQFNTSLGAQTINIIASDYYGIDELKKKPSAIALVTSGKLLSIPSATNGYLYMAYHNYFVDTTGSTLVLTDRSNPLTMSSRNGATILVTRQILASITSLSNASAYFALAETNQSTTTPGTIIGDQRRYPQVTINALTINATSVATPWIQKALSTLFSYYTISYVLSSGTVTVDNISEDFAMSIITNVPSVQDYYDNKFRTENVLTAGVAA